VYVLLFIDKSCAVVVSTALRWMKF